MVAAVVVHPAGAHAALAPAFVTVLFGRSMMSQSESCQAIGPNLFRVAELLAARGVAATGVVTPGRTANTGVQCITGNLYPSWRELARLRDEFGWTFVSNGQQRLDITTLGPAGQRAESCGSLAAFESRGHTRAWGMYGPGSNLITDAIARSPVGDCFAFTRLYSGTTVNGRAAVVLSPWYVRTDDTNGGRCHLDPCSGNAGMTKRYMLPSEIRAGLSQARADTWVVLSTYKLVEGKRLSGARRWDCSQSDARKHWTNEVESYCLVDFLAALAAMPAGARVVDPATVATAYGRRPGG